MRVRTARQSAAAWVMRHAAGEPDFRGAYFSGSTIALPDDAELPAASDVDVTVVTACPDPPRKPGKFRHQGVLLEVSFLSQHQLGSPEQVLGAYHLAGSFRTDTIIADSTGQLRRLYAEVSRRYAEPHWVRRRCEAALSRIEDRLRESDPAAPLPDHVLSWLFPTGVTTHVILSAALRNPTVRLRYLAARQVLMEHRRPEMYEELLELLGCAGASRDDVADRLHDLGRTFDAAADAARTWFPFSSDITYAARPIAIDGSWELVEAGFHREAVFWIIATFARCHSIMVADAPEVHCAYAPAFHAALAGIGIAGPSDLPARAEQVLGYLPRLWTVAEHIMASRGRGSGR